LWDSAPELESNQTEIQHIFLVVNSFLQLDFKIAMIHVLSDLRSWLSGQSIALCEREIASSDPNCALLTKWQRRANTF
jgi:hypothetical protein